MVIQRSLKVLSYNIHKGFSFANRQFTLPEIRAALIKAAPDVVFLQEVVGRHDLHARAVAGWPELPQSDYLAHTIWPFTAYGQTAVFDHGHQGNAILSRYPITRFENISISTNPLERRAILHAQVELPGVQRPVHCICVHLDLFERGRSRQLRWLCERVWDSVGAGDPLIIAGDFNDWRQQASRVLVGELGVYEVLHTLQGGYAATFPTRYPVLKLDRVYTRGLNALKGGALLDKPWGQLSDHAPLLVELGASCNEKNLAGVHVVG
jgi:endonuclease/exonuclease/phosphatase family metal-dependent hydrolase